MQTKLPLIPDSEDGIPCSSEALRKAARAYRENHTYYEYVPDKTAFIESEHENFASMIEKYVDNVDSVIQDMQQQINSMSGYDVWEGPAVMKILQDYIDRLNNSNK